MPATAEQKLKAVERRERFRELVKQVGNMSEDQRAELASRIGAVVTTEGRPLSVHNTCLIAMQRQGCSIVGGFRQWLKQGRCVEAGQHGLMIWVPIRGKTDKGGPVDSSYSGEPIADTADAATNPKTRFIAGNVFDISQTIEIGGQSR